jgi:tetratricopeptide (TPR) repeat protein
MAAAPPAPAKPPDEKASADNFSIVVTGARKRSRAAERGDWNSCTINDPRQDLSACRSLIDPSAKGDKGQADAHLADGLLFAWQGNADRAIAAFDQAIAIAPKSTLALLNRGLAHQKQGDSEQALADFNLAIKLAPDDPKLYYNRGLLLREQGDIKRARPDQRRATDLDDSYDTIDPERRGR